MNKRKVLICGDFENLNKKVYKKIKSKNNIYIINRIKIDDLLFNEYCKIILVIDSFYIEKYLNLIIEILEINNNLILCFKNNDRVKINFNKLSSLLKINIIDIKNLNLINELININNFEKNNFELESEYIKSEINNISDLLPSIENKNYISIKLLEGDKNIVNLIKVKLDINILTIDLNDYLRNINFEKIKDERYIKINDFCNNLIKQTIIYNEKNNINKILSSKLFGIFLILIIPLIIILLTIILYKIITIPLLKFNFIFNNSLLLSGFKSIYLFTVITFIPTVVILIFYELIFKSGLLSLTIFHLDKIFYNFESSGKIYKLYLDKYIYNEPINIESLNKEEKNISVLSSVFYPSLNKFILIIFFINIFFPNIKFIKLMFLLLFIFLSLIFISLILYKIISIFIYINNSSLFNVEDLKLRFPVINIKDKIKNIYIKKIKYVFLIGIILYLLTKLNLNIYWIVIISYLLSFLLNETVLIIFLIFYFNMDINMDIKIILPILMLFIFNLPNIFNIKKIKKETYFKYKWLVIVSPFILALLIDIIIYLKFF